MIDFHFSPTPNCFKVAILLEELELPYRIVPYDLYKGEHLTPAFAIINPNLKVPAIVDNEPAGGGEPVAVFESGAILIYLAEKTGRFLPTDVRSRTEALQWLVWQVAGLGPMLGQAGHFLRYAPEGQEYGIKRYVNEAARLTNVLEGRLRRSEYLAGGYGIADVAVWPWMGNGALVGLELEKFPQLQRWLGSIGQRPAVQRVFANRQTAIDPKYLQQKMVLKEEEWSNMFGEKMLSSVLGS